MTDPGMRAATMRALVKTQRGKGHVELREVPVPKVGRGGVLIEVQAVGVCGTDLHILLDEFPYYPPVILGHEFAGVVCELGSEVVGWSVGDRVVAEPHTQACRTCRYCQTGNLYLCPRRRSIGWGQDGACARFLSMPAHLLHRIPAGLAMEHAAIAEPLASVVHAVLLRGRVLPGDTVVVEGCGPIGLMAAQVARAAGAGRTVITGTAADASRRLPIAVELGVDAAIDISAETDVVERVMGLTGGHGADVVVEASGSPAAVALGIRMLRRRGLLLGVGLNGAEAIPVPWDMAVVKALDIAFSFSTTYTSWETALSLLAEGRVDAERLITHRAPLEEWEHIFDLLQRREGVKAVLIP